MSNNFLRRGRRLKSADFSDTLIGSDDSSKTLYEENNGEFKVKSKVWTKNMDQRTTDLCDKRNVFQDQMDNLFNTPASVKSHRDNVMRPSNAMPKNSVSRVTRSKILENEINSAPISLSEIAERQQDNPVWNNATAKNKFRSKSRRLSPITAEIVNDQTNRRGTSLAGSKLFKKSMHGGNISRYPRTEYNYDVRENYATNKSSGKSYRDSHSVYTARESKMKSHFVRDEPFTSDSDSDSYQSCRTNRVSKSEAISTAVIHGLQDGRLSPNMAHQLLQIIRPGLESVKKLSETLLIDTHSRNRAPSIRSRARSHKSIRSHRSMKSFRSRKSSHKSVRSHYRPRNPSYSSDSDNNDAYESGAPTADEILRNDNRGALRDIRSKNNYDNRNSRVGPSVIGTQNEFRKPSLNGLKVIQQGKKQIEETLVGQRTAYDVSLKERSDLSIVAPKLVQVPKKTKSEEISKKSEISIPPKALSVSSVPEPTEITLLNNKQIHNKATEPKPPSRLSELSNNSLHIFDAAANVNKDDSSQPSFIKRKLFSQSVELLDNDPARALRSPSVQAKTVNVFNKNDAEKLRKSFNARVSMKSFAKPSKLDKDKTSTLGLNNDMQGITAGPLEKKLSIPETSVNLKSNITYIGPPRHESTINPDSAATKKLLTDLNDKNGVKSDLTIGNDKDFSSLPNKDKTLPSNMMVSTTDSAFNKMKNVHKMPDPQVSNVTVHTPLASKSSSIINNAGCISTRKQKLAAEKPACVAGTDSSVIVKLDTSKLSTPNERRNKKNNLKNLNGHIIENDSDNCKLRHDSSHSAVESNATVIHKFNEKGIAKIIVDDCRKVAKSSKWLTDSSEDEVADEARIRNSIDPISNERVLRKSLRKSKNAPKRWLHESENYESAVESNSKPKSDNRQQPSKKRKLSYTTEDSTPKGSKRLNSVPNQLAKDTNLKESVLSSRLTDDYKVSISNWEKNEELLNNFKPNNLIPDNGNKTSLNVPKNKMPLYNNKRLKEIFDSSREYVNTPRRSPRLVCKNKYFQSRNYTSKAEDLKTVSVRSRAQFPKMDMTQVGSDRAEDKQHSSSVLEIVKEKKRTIDIDRNPFPKPINNDILNGTTSGSSIKAFKSTLSPIPHLVPNNGIHGRTSSKADNMEKHKLDSLAMITQSEASEAPNARKVTDGADIRDLWKTVEDHVRGSKRGISYANIDILSDNETEQLNPSMKMITVTDKGRNILERIENRTSARYGCGNGKGVSNTTSHLKGTLEKTACSRFNDTSARPTEGTVTGLFQTSKIRDVPKNKLDAWKGPNRDGSSYRFACGASSISRASSYKSGKSSKFGHCFF